MIIKIDDARVCYDEIVKKVRRIKGGRVLIFVAFDIDSLCSLRLLIILLRGDNVRFEVIPVMNFSILEKKIDEYKLSFQEKRDISSIVMLNCGGTIDLTGYWFTESVNDILCFIIDSHRPANHNNIHHESIIFIDDTKYNLDDVPKEEDLKEVKEADSDFDDLSNMEENEAEFDENGEERTSSGKIKKKKDDLKQEDDYYGEDREYFNDDKKKENELINKENIDISYEERNKNNQNLSNNEKDEIIRKRKLKKKKRSY